MNGGKESVDEDDGNYTTPDGEFEIEAIRKHKIDFKKMKIVFNVKWKGYDDRENTWE